MIWLTVAAVSPVPVVFPTPVTVTVANPDSPWTFGWAAVAAILALAGVWELSITLRRRARKSKLTAEPGDITLSVSRPGAKTQLYSIGLRVLNAGNKGLKRFRATFYFPCERGEIVAIVGRGEMVRGGTHPVDGERRPAVEYTVGPIFVDDDVWIGNVDVYLTPGRHKIFWVLKSNDGRVPVTGYGHFYVDCPSS